MRLGSVAAAAAASRHRRRTLPTRGGPLGSMTAARPPRWRSRCSRWHEATTRHDPRWFRFFSQACRIAATLPQTRTRTSAMIYILLGVIAIIFLRWFAAAVLGEVASYLIANRRTHLVPSTTKLLRAIGAKQAALELERDMWEQRGALAN